MLFLALFMAAAIAGEVTAFVSIQQRHRPLPSNNNSQLIHPQQKRFPLARPSPPFTLLHSIESGEASSVGPNGNNSDDDLKGGNNFYNDFEDLVGQQQQQDDNTNNLQQPPPPQPPIGSRTTTTPQPTPDPSFFTSLQKRQDQLRTSSRELLERWTAGSADTFPAFTINEQFYAQAQERNTYGSSREEREAELPFDWIRKMSIGSYPRVACGSAHGSVFVADVESRRVLGSARNVHSSRHGDEMADMLDESLRHLLYGEYDGGGVLSVAMHGTNLVASSGREGGAKLFRLDGGGELKYTGDVLSGMTTSTPLVTCLEFDSSGRLVMGGQDGILRMATFAQDGAKGDGANMVQLVTLTSSPSQTSGKLSPILSLDISEELEMVATAHANGNVCIHSIVDNAVNEIMDVKDNIWNPFGSDIHARSVAFVTYGDDGDACEQNSPSSHCGIVVGGGNGELWMQELHPSRYGNVPNPAAAAATDTEATTTTAQPLFREDSTQQIRPNHQGPVVTMASRPGGILVSADQYGLLRMMQLSSGPKTASKTLYGLGGYKVWIGDVCIDSEGKRLLSDGRDDVCVVHDFSSDDDSWDV